MLISNLVINELLYFVVARVTDVSRPGQWVERTRGKQLSSAVDGRTVRTSVFNTPLQSSFVVVVDECFVERGLLILLLHIIFIRSRVGRVSVSRFRNCCRRNLLNKMFETPLEVNDNHCCLL